MKVTCVSELSEFTVIVLRHHFITGEFGVGSGKWGVGSEVKFNQRNEPYRIVISKPKKKTE